MIRVALAALLLLVGTAEASRRPGAVVRVEFDGKIASGVHIGNGFILTAQHVVDKSPEITFLLDNGSDLHTAQVLWSNYDYDVALIHAPMEDVSASELSCRTPAVGEPVVAIGNLNGHRFFRSPGHVATEPENVDRWHDVYAVAGANGGGMSGGPVVDSEGRIVGLTVAGPGRIGPYGLIVSGTAICKLLGRVK